MPRIVALDFDMQTCQVVVVERRPTGTSIHHAGQFQLENEVSTYAPAELAEKIHEELGHLKLGKAKLAVLVGGDDVQYRILDLPPAPKEDLPDMVRFQSVREFAAADEDSPLDYVPLQGSETIPHQVLAARLRATAGEQARELSEELACELAHLVPRGVALAFACRRLMPELASGKHLIAAPVGNQLEMVLLRDGEVVLLRRARVSGEMASDTVVLGELRRTVAAAAAQLGGPVDLAVLVGEKLPPGENTESMSWAKLVSLDLTKLLTDWGVKSADKPAESARLAPVLEAALMVADRNPPALDFAHPRQRVVVETPKRTRILAGVAAATVLLAAGFYFVNQLLSLDRETARLNALTEEKINSLKEYDSFVERATAIEQWLATDITWLDELERTTLALRPLTLDDPNYPAAEDVIVKQIRTRRPDLRNDSSGVIELDTLAKNSNSLNPIEERLRDKTHDVQPGKLGQETAGGDYPLTVRYDVTIRSADANSPGGGK